MQHFEGIAYLKQGNERQRAAYRALVQHQVMEKLAAFGPLLAGTIPLGIDVAESDLDIICCWACKADFEETLQLHFGDAPDFCMGQAVVRGRESVVASCKLGGFAVEFFGQNRAAQEQEAYRHMLIEYRLLEDYGETLREQVVALKKAGMKTEPAFAKLLNLPGDPYEALLLLEGDAPTGNSSNRKRRARSSE